jgi:signal transduction histidine kinase
MADVEKMAVDMTDKFTASYGRVDFEAGGSSAEDEARRARAWATEYNVAVAENERRGRQISALYELWRSVGQTEPGRLLQRITERAVSVMDAHSCSVLLRERGGDTMHIVASVGLAQDIAETMTFIVGERISGRVAATGQPILVNKDPRNHPLLQNGQNGVSAPDITRRPEVESSLCSPLVGADGAIVGVLCVSRFAPAPAFNEGDLRVVSLFAAMAGAIIGQNRAQEDWTRAVQEAAQLERELSHSARLAALGQLSATVAHEVRNPLSSIKGAAQFLLQEFSEKNENHQSPERFALLRDFLHIVVEEVNGLGRLTTDLLEFARPAPPEKKPMDLVTLIHSATEFLRPEMERLGVDVVVNVSALPNREQRICAPVEGDVSQIEQMLRNLLLNAAQAAGYARADVLSDEAEDKEKMAFSPKPFIGAVTVTLTHVANEWLLCVRDDGPGVSPDALERLWEPFFTTRARGTGLGLALVRRVAEEHGGRVYHEPAPRGGAMFTVALPASGIANTGDNEATAQTVQAASTEKDRDNGHVVITNKSNEDTQSRESRTNGGGRNKRERGTP